MSNFVPEDKLPQIAGFLFDEVQQMEDEFQQVLEEGYEEAYAMLQAERKRWESPYK